MKVKHVKLIKWFSQRVVHISNHCWRYVYFCFLYFVLLHFFLQENPSKHPIIILKDVSYSHLQAILEFMYAGEVNVSQEQLPAFLKTADRLKVKGLAETPASIKREG